MKTFRNISLRCAAALAAAALLAWALSGCSVKEDRSPCPVWVKLFFLNRLPANAGEVMTLFVYRDGEKESVMNVDCDRLDEGLEFSFMSGYVDFAGVSGWPSEDYTPDAVLIHYGDDCPGAWGFRDGCDARDELTVVNANMRALYANMYIEIVRAGKGYPYYPEIEGDVDGYWLPSLSLHHGPFRCVPREYEPFRYWCRVPRQDDRSLLLKLFPMDDMPTKAAAREAVYTLNVTDVLAEKGYHWETYTLEDIHIVVDLATLRITISVGDWTTVVMMAKYVI